MKVLITGGAGFIGAALAHRLLDRGDSVHAVDTLNDYYEVSLKEARLARQAEGHENQQADPDLLPRHYRTSSHGHSRSGAGPTGPRHLSKELTHVLVF